MSQKLAVYYQVSKDVSTVTGNWLGLQDFGPNGFTPVIQLTEEAEIRGQNLEAGAALVLDPRCVVKDAEDNEIVYNPWDHIAQLPEFARKWLREHPRPAARLGQAAL